jgi:hypothetical protein
VSPAYQQTEATAAGKEVTYRGLQQPSGLPEWRQVEEQLYRLGEDPHTVWKLWGPPRMGGGWLAHRQHAVIRERNVLPVAVAQQAFPLAVLADYFPSMFGTRVESTE